MKRSANGLMVPRVAHLLAVVVAISSTARCSAAAAVPLCSEQEVQGKQSFVSGACIWPPNHAQPSQPAVQLEGTAAGFFPRIVLRPEGSSTPGNTSKHAGFNLSMKRLFLLNVTLSAPSQGPGPKLLPLGLFSTAPTNLSMMDVRLAVGPAAFQQYLTFFLKSLRAVRTKDDGGVGMHTDGVSFLNVPYWSDANTELYSVTLMSGPCMPPASQSFNTALSWLATAPGCNVRLVTNDTLVPTLLRDATANTTQPLLVRLVTNVSLGLNVQQPIVFRRPVLLVGTSSTPISVDLGMVVNQLDVSAETAQLAWQAVVLENLAPGDAVTSIMAPPYSITVSMNVWAVYCNRSRDMCVPLTNVTLVIPSQDEISYLTFMATMFNSPSPSLRQLADFYITDLKMTKFEVQPTSNNDILTVLFLVTNAWQMWYVVMQTQPVFAPKLAAPRQVFNQLQYRTGVLVQAIRDCSSFQATQGFAPNRVHVWQLVDDISIGGPNCTWSPPINVTGPTTLFGEVASQGTAPSMRSYLQVAAPTGASAGPAASREAARNASNPLSVDPGANQSSIFTGIATNGTVNTLSFQYTEGLINLPADAPDRYFQIRNITLRQLPQAHGMHRDGSGRHSHGVERGRRLMQEPAPPVMGGLAAMPSDTHPGVFTMLLWPLNRTLSGSPLFITDSQLMLPQPEWDLIAQAARSARHFAIELDGSANLLFTGVTLVDSNVLTAEAYVGPGIVANRVRLLPDPAAASAHPLYYWPMSAAAASSGQNSRLSPAAQAGIGVAVAVVGVLVLAAAAMLLMRRRRRRQARRALLEHKRLLQQGVVPVLPLAGDGTVGGIGGVAGGSAGPALLSGSVPLNSKGSAGLLRGSSNSDLNLLSEQNQHLHSHGSSAAAAAIAGNGAAATAAEACAASRPLSAGGSDRLLVCGSTVGTDTATTCTVASTVTPLGISPRLSSAAELELSIAQGLKNWNDAVSLQTMQLMQQRLQASSMRCYQRQFTASTSTLSSSQGVSMAGRQAGQTDVGVAASAAAAAAAAGDNSKSSSARSSNNDRHDDLQLFEVIGSGSFGAVYLGSWRGKQVAVKVMHLPAQAFQKDQQQLLLQMAHQQQQQNPAQQRQLQQRARMQQQNSKPHMAIMEAVLSTNLHHPNVVQVYTFMLNPLTAQRQSAANSAANSRRASLVEPLGQQQQQQQQEQLDEAAEKQEGIFGWTLQLVMEFCDQGTLRDQLDNHMLPHLPHSSQIQPAVAVALSHDIAAAMLHLHREGIVHGDLKAGNVLLQASTAVRAGNMAQKQALLQAWMAAGCLPLTAKVADFGLALPLGHTDTHATLLARGTPSHMGPEVFMSGHISKASDVYAFGVLLYEIATGQRAYAGIAVPLLPHRVAVEGLRPVWPSGVMTDLRRLAESCWAQKPQQRPNFQDILMALEKIEVGAEQPAATAAAALAATSAPHAAQNGEQANTVQTAAAGGPRLAAGCVGNRPVPPLPPRHSKPPQQQQQQEQPVQQHAWQQQQQQVEHHAAEPGAGAAGLFAGHGAAPGHHVGANEKDLDWSEVSCGRPTHYVREF